ncbi:MAG: hypothetical protein K0R29_1655 [Pseudobdellovibrio sp.]|jgi:hypothetical protein|nr:hypothetical protein [Pseudobdellovibrio sp.]
MVMFFSVQSYAIPVSPIIGLGQENLGLEASKFIPNSDKGFKFQPNIAGVLRVGISAFGFSAGYSFRGSEKEIDPAKAKTDMTEIQLGYNAENWGIDGFYQTYKGFFTEGTSAVQNYPDLEFKHFGFISRYAFNDSEFSVGGLLDQSYPVTQTATKYYLVGGLNEDIMNTDVSLLQQENAGIDQGFEDMRKLRSFIAKLGVGAGTQWVSESRFFVGGLFDILGSYANYKFESINGESTLSDSTMSFNMKLGFGYSGEKYKSGMSLSTDITNLKTPGRGLLSPSSNRILIYFRWLADL